ncbi:MAG: hypothetical protein R3E10_18625 [Gemmatimonadota bacterium]
MHWTRRHRGGRTTWTFVRAATATALVVLSILPRTTDGLLAQAPTSGSCFDVELGDWAPVEQVPSDPRLPTRRPDLTGDSVIYSVPRRVRFDADSFAWGEPGGRRLRTPEHVLPVPHRWTGWWVRGDTLQLTVSTGFAGTSATLLGDGSDWTGTLRTFSDVGNLQRWTRALRLAPVGCDAPTDQPAALEAPLPREILLEDGTVLQLGAPIPEGLATSERRDGRSFLVHAAVIGPFAGADSVVVERSHSDDVVASIRLEYTEGPGSDALVEIVTRLSDGRGPLSRAYGSAFWYGRSGHVMVSEGRNGAVRVILRDPRSTR